MSKTIGTNYELTTAEYGLLSLIAQSMNTDFDILVAEIGGTVLSEKFELLSKETLTASEVIEFAKVFLSRNISAQSLGYWRDNFLTKGTDYFDDGANKKQLYRYSLKALLPHLTKQRGK